ncbi:ATP-dependent helicase [Streptomyces cyaneochromogenes]|uniref:ATP-dependent helicase n=1 Tax=Streptomyces cyaneochromogenes TaxID=2496836 RepID=A0A3Q9ETH8_9ACTN|nr:ATP-dependent helicase [Streptomyces cyaneochromogenes]AZQ38517.1 ATP-dependent helicase [Streptomyces cyaneochromogenes]
MARLDTLEAVATELEARRSFLVEAGAGAGKTTTLVRALQHLLTHRRADLEAHGRRIACITYTNVAKKKIHERIAADPLVDVDTIHEFLWSVIQPYQHELWQQILDYNKDLSKPEDLDDVTDPPAIEYSDRGRRLHEGRISHDDVIALSLRLVTAHPKLVRIITSKYPAILVDEYQDTSPKTIQLLRDHLAGAGREKCVVGLFGDSMQKIYESGVGAVKRPGLLTEITKHENYRCSPPVVEVLNRMRPELTQDAVGEQQTGEVHLFLNSSTPAGPERLTAAEAVLARNGWTRENSKYLLLTHRGIAGTLEYANLLEQYRKLGRYGPDDLMARNEPYIQYLTRVEAVSTAFHNNDFAELTELLDEGRTRITRHAHKRAISDAIRALDAVRTTGTIGEVLDLMADGHLLALPGKLKDLEHRRSATNLDERDQRRADFSHNLRTVSYREVISITHFIDELTPFSTQHGVKGDEFENVVVVVDDRAWNRYSIGKMLAGTDKPDRTERSRNLFYVCCSRAQRGLAVVFIDDLPDGAKSTLHAWFESGTIHP